MNAFWMVWSPQGSTPTFRHTTPVSAQNEAARLLRESPHREFFVLEAINKVQFKPDEKPIEFVALDNMPF